MTLDNVLEEITKKAKDDAKALKEQGMNEAKQILKKAKENAAEIEKSVTDETSKTTEAMEKREIASTKLNCKRIELDAKKVIIDEVFESLKERVSKLDEKTKKRIYDKMIKKAAAEMDIKYIYVNQKDAILAKSITSNIEIKDAGIAGGIIFENKDKNVRIDCTFDSVLEDVKEECLKDITKILFNI